MTVPKRQGEGGYCCWGEERESAGRVVFATARKRSSPALLRMRLLSGASQAFCPALSGCVVSGTSQAFLLCSEEAFLCGASQAFILGSDEAFLCCADGPPALCTHFGVLSL